MFIGAVVDDKIHKDTDIPSVSLPEEFIHVFHSAEPRIYIVIIRDIISLVSERGDVNRTQPDDIDAQIPEIIQLADNTLKISYAVSVAVTEAFRINLICYFFIPPLSVHFYLFSGSALMSGRR